MGRALLPTATNVASIFGELTGRLATYIRSINDLRAAEKAQELGIATKQQDLLLLELRKEKIEEQIIAEKRLFETQDENESFTSQFARDNVRLLELQLTGKERLIGEIKGQISVESQLSEDQAHQADIEKKAAQDREQEARIKEQNYKKQIGFIDDVILASKSEIDVIDEEIAQLQALDTQDEETRKNTQDEETRKRQLEAIQLLQAEKQTILDEEQQALDDANKERQEKILALFDEEKEAVKEKNREELEGAEDLKNKKIALRQEEADFVIGIVGSLESVWNNLNVEKLNNIESEKNADIDALDKELIATEAWAEAVKTINNDVSIADKDGAIEALDAKDVANTAYAAEKKAIEQQAANDAFDIKLSEFNANKALALTQIAIDTAIGVAKVYGQTGIFGLAAQVPVIAAGVAQAGIVLSQQPPPKPQLATGAIIPGSQRGVDVTVAEGGNDESILGGGSKGDAILQRFADKINANGGGNSKTVVNFNSLVSVLDPQQLRMFAQTINPYIEEVQESGL